MNKKQQVILKNILKGPDAISLQYFPFFMGITFPVLLILENIWKFDGQDRLFIILAKASGYAFMYIYFRLIKFACGARMRRSLSFPVLLILSGMGGAIQGSVSGVLLDVLGFNASISTLNRTFTAFFVSLSWLPINAVASTAIAKFRENRSDLLRRSNQIAKIAFEQEGLAKSIRQRVENDIVDELNWSRDLAHSKFQLSIDKGINVSNMNSQLIKEYASKDLRSISHRLWGQAEQRSKAIPSTKSSELRSLWQLYRMSYFLPPVASSIQSFIVLTLFLPIFLRGYSIGIQVKTALMISVLFYGILRIGDWFYKRFPDRSAWIIPLRSLSAAASSIAASFLLTKEILNNALESPVLRPISGAIIYVVVDVALAISKSALYSQEDQSEALYRSFGSQKAEVNLANLEIALISREWAQHIHGSLATKLITSAVILEKTVGNLDLSSKADAIDEVTRIMNGDFAIPNRVNRDLMQELLHRVHQWNSIIEIQVQGEVTLNIPTVSSVKFGLAIEEALANAYRHGRAKRVEILLKQLNELTFECTITDDGIGLDDYERDGLGSSLFEAISPGVWSRKAGPNGQGVQVHLLIKGSGNPSLNSDISS